MPLCSRISFRLCFNNRFQTICFHCVIWFVHCNFLSYGFFFSCALEFSLAQRSQINFVRTWQLSNGYGSVCSWQGKEIGNVRSCYCYSTICCFNYFQRTFLIYIVMQANIGQHNTSILVVKVLFSKPHVMDSILYLLVFLYTFHFLVKFILYINWCIRFVINHPWPSGSGIRCFPIVMGLNLVNSKFC